MPGLMLGTLEIECESFPGVLSTLQANQGWFELAILEWWNAPTEFLKYQPAVLDKVKAHPADLISGSIFGPSVELHWRKVNGKYWLVLTGEFQPDPSMVEQWKWLDQKTELSPAWDGQAPTARQVNLWGSQFSQLSGDSSEWMELRIPRPVIEYPVHPAPDGKLDLVRLKLLEYHAADGTVIAYRRCGLWAAKKAN